MQSNIQTNPVACNKVASLSLAIVLTLTTITQTLVAAQLQVQSNQSLKNLVLPKEAKQQEPDHISTTKPRILCWILSVDNPTNNQKSQSVVDTWGTRCDKLLIVKNGTHLQEVGNILTLPIAHEGRNILWQKVSSASKYIFDKYSNQYDWFMKADDDTYVIVESLRAFLSQHDPRDPVYFGHKLRPFVKQGYMSGGSGYVLSREALRRLVKLGIEKGLARCHLEETEVEDVRIGQCLEAVQVKAGDSRDHQDRETFFPLPPQMLFKKELPSMVPWFSKYTYFPSTRRAIRSHKRIISDQPIAFHYMTPESMRYTDFLLYQVRRQSTPQ